METPKLSNGTDCAQSAQKVHNHTLFILKNGKINSKNLVQAKSNLTPQQPTSNLNLVFLVVCGKIWC